MFNLTSYSNHTDNSELYNQKPSPVKPTAKGSVDELLTTIWKNGDQCRELDKELRMASVRTEHKVSEISKELESKKSEIAENLRALREMQVISSNDLDHEHHSLVKKFIERGEFQLVQTNEDLSKFSDPMKMIESLLQSHEGVCIGEHHDEAVLQFLINQSAKIITLGVKTLFLEGLDYEDQPAIDSYLKGDLKPLTETDNGSKWKLKTLDIAKDLGIRIVGIDSREAKKADGIERLLLMNHVAMEAIRNEKNGKFIAVMGGAHLTSCYGEALPGVAELTKTPAIEIYKDKDAKTSTQKMFANRYGNLRTPPSGVAVIERPNLNYTHDVSDKQVRLNPAYESLMDDELLETIWQKGDLYQELALKLELEMISLQFGSKNQVEEVSKKLELQRSDLKSALLSLSKREMEVPEQDTQKTNSLIFVKESLSNGGIKHVQFEEDLSIYSSPIAMMGAALSKHEGVTIGHAGGDVFAYVMKHSEQLKSSGVDTVFLEEFECEDQHEIDLYLEGNKEPFLNKIEHPSLKQHLVDKLEAAMKAGIRIVGIDSKHAHSMYSERSLLMNEAARDVIQKEKVGKFVTITTVSHITSCLGGALPGIAELTNTPSIEIYQNTQALKSFQSMMINRFGDLRTAPSGVAVIEN